MDKMIVCECSCNRFLYFGKYVRCPDCNTEFREIRGIIMFRKWHDDVTEESHFGLWQEYKW